MKKPAPRSSLRVPVGGVRRGVRGEPAVDAEDLTGHERGVVGREERDRPGDLLGIAEPADEMARAVAAQAVTHRAAEPLLRRLVDDDARRDRVAADAALAVRGRDVARERDDAGLRRAVRRERLAAVERGRRRGVDDRAATALQHRGDREPAAEHRAGEVHREDAVPRGEIHRRDVLIEAVLVERGRVVVQHVEAAVRGDRVGDHRLDCCRVGDVDDLGRARSRRSPRSRARRRPRHRRRCRRRSRPRLPRRGAVRWRGRCPTRPR